VQILPPAPLDFSNRVISALSFRFIAAVKPEIPAPIIAIFIIVF
jgi:hypothetical protein